MPTLHSHTHWQAPQADTQAKACQRVCLSHAEKKKLKIPFPSKNFKNANSQTDTTTFGQLVAKLNKDKGCKTRTTRTPACNRRLAQWRVTWLIEHSTSHQLLWCIDSFVLRNPPLRQAPNR
jgi:hypothetical protein